jgi:hypothetical protein
MKKAEDVRLALVFKDFAAWIRTSCVGLNVAGFTTAQVLREYGVDVTVFPVRHNVDIVHAVDKYNETHDKPLTHVVISAPWLSLHDLKSLVKNFKDIEFVILSHSNVGFLQADPEGVELLRKYQELSEKYPNLKVGGNSERFVEWFEKAYEREAVLLPNLYPLTYQRQKEPWDGVSPIKIGAFGAVRPEKNFMTATAAAVLIQKELQVPVEFHMSSGGEGDQGRVSPAIGQMTDNIPGFTLVRHNWQPWDQFIHLVSSMDLLIQVSYTESFNMVTADGVLAGVPSVVSSAIYWAPDSWKADADDAVEISEVGINLLLRDDAAIQGTKALIKHNKRSIEKWFHFLYGKKENFFERLIKFFRYTEPF